MSEQDKSQPEESPKTEEPEETTDAQAADATEGTPPAEDHEAEAVPEEPDPAIEIAALNDKLLRALADGENIRRRAKKEREDTAKYAIANFARDMLSVADNLRRALEAAPEENEASDEAAKALADGVRLTEREITSAFDRHGIERIDPMGEKFNHDFHEAMFEMPSADAEPGTVVQVFEVGYVLNQRLLRAAKVAVAKATEEPTEHEHVDTTV